MKNKKARTIRCDTAAPAHPRSLLVEYPMKPHSFPPDANLLALGEQYRALIEAMRKANERVAVVSDRFSAENLPFPKAALVGRFDWYLFRDTLPGWMELKGAVGEPYSITERERLAAKPITSRSRRRPTKLEKAQAEFGKFDRIIGAREPSPRGQHRACEILAAYALHRSDEDRRAKAIGLTAAEKEIERLCEQQAFLNEAIIAEPCNTLAGLAVKAQAMARIHEEYGDPGEDYVEQRMMRALFKAVLDVADHPNGPPTAPAANRLGLELLRSDAA